MGKIDAGWWANIPLNEFRQAFQLNDEDFETKYGARKPDLDDDIILQCRSGTNHLVAKFWPTSKILNIVFRCSKSSSTIHAT